MKAILSRLQTHCDRFKIIEFSEDTILNQPVETWPKVDTFLSFYSGGFPLKKACEYERLHGPFSIQDCENQFKLLSRVEILQTLKKFNIPTAGFLIVDREDTKNQPDFQEFPDHIVCNGQKFYKPFVEKPFDADDHEIVIYFRTKDGGGSQKLFRKVDNKSSEYCENGKVRRDKSYVYEEYRTTFGTDLKVYTVGNAYAHTEARKAPVLDGVVDRDENGKEVRYPCILSPEEKRIAKRVSKAFKQTLCGFDLLRSDKGSFVCDVNGMSFVKGNNEYYDDCAMILSHKILYHFDGPMKNNDMLKFNFPRRSSHVENILKNDQRSKLRAIIGVFQHAETTPKHKQKLNVGVENWLGFFGQEDEEQDTDDPYKSEVTLKSKTQLLEYHSVLESLIANKHENPSQRRKFKDAKLILESQGLNFKGVCRKVQLKRKRNQVKIVTKAGGIVTDDGLDVALKTGDDFHSFYCKLRGTTVGQAHNTLFDDIKVYAADEGRIQMTAAAFTKGFLGLKSSKFPAILSTLITKSSHLLDTKLEDTLSKKRRSLIEDQILESVCNESTDDETENPNIDEVRTLSKRLYACLTSYGKIVQIRNKLPLF